MTDVVVAVTEIAEDWLVRALVRASESLRSPHRTPCTACRASGLMDALGEFGGWPHMLVHPLLDRITDLLDEVSDERFRHAIRPLRERWADRVSLDGDGDEPDGEYLLWAARVHADELEDEREIERRAYAWDTWVAASALGDFCSERAELARDVIARLVDRAVDAIATLPKGSTIESVEAAELSSALHDALIGWVLWLPTRAWVASTPVEQGSVCAVCRQLGIADRFTGPHAVLHRLTVGLTRVVSRHSETYGTPRVEPPVGGEFDAYLDELAVLTARWLDDASDSVARALEDYVVGDVADVISTASAYLAVTGEDDEGVASGDRPD